MTAIDRSVTVTLTGDDYAIANKLFVLNSYRAPRVLAAVAIFATVGALLLLAPLAGYPLGTWGGPLGGFAFGMLILAAPLSVINYYFIAPYQARSTYRKHKTLHSSFTFSWSEAGLKIAGGGSEWTTHWADYLKLSENDQMILFFQAPRLFQMLPKRALATEQIADLLRCAASVHR